MIKEFTISIVFFGELCPDPDPCVNGICVDGTCEYDDGWDGGMEEERVERTPPSVPAKKGKGGRERGQAA